MTSRKSTLILDDRHIREMFIAFAAIVLVWPIACGLTIVSTFFFGEASSLDGPTAIIGHWLEQKAQHM